MKINQDRNKTILKCPVCKQKSIHITQEDEEIINAGCEICPFSLIGNIHKGDTEESLKEMISKIKYDGVFDFN